MPINKMAESKINSTGTYISVKKNASVAGGAEIFRLTIPKDGLYIISYSGFETAGLFNGIATTTDQYYHGGSAWTFTKKCKENEIIKVTNPAGTAKNFNAYFEALRIK